MKRGFMARNTRKQPDSLGGNNDRLDRPIFSEGGSNRLGSARGVPTTTPKFSMNATRGLSWSTTDNSERNRWNKTSTSPWKTTFQKSGDSNPMEEEDASHATGSTYPSTAATEPSSLASAAAATQPVLPHGAMMEAPRAALYDWYLKQHQTQAVVKDCYFTWDNGGLPHERVFTSIFVCPVTGELFATGRYGPRVGTKKKLDSITHEAITERRYYYGQKKDELTGANVVWFTDKTSSQHGAAARAYDCFSYRRYQPLGMPSVHLGDEEPYLTEKDAPPLPTMPEDIRNKVEAQRRRIATHRTQAASINAPAPAAPKAALSAWYGTKPRSHQLSKNNYVSWNNLAQPHLLKFTSLFVCPLSGEVFSSGKCGSADSYEEGTDVNGNTIVWYNKKVLAEHAAAARAYDCWCLRFDGRESNFLGQDEPYRSADDAPKCPVMPSAAEQKVSQLQEEASRRIPIPAMNPSLPMQSEEEARKDRDEYRAARGTNASTNMGGDW